MYNNNIEKWQLNLSVCDSFQQDNKMLIFGSHKTKIINRYRLRKQILIVFLFGSLNEPIIWEIT